MRRSVTMAGAVLKLTLESESDALDFGAALFRARRAGCLIFLSGDLGAGKTTVVRGYLRAAGHQGAVKSPTYTLVEEYCVAGERIDHFDLYRLSDPEELEWMGIRDYLSGEAVCLVEWPERGSGVLPRPDLWIRMAVAGSERPVEVEPMSDSGRAMADSLR